MERDRAEPDPDEEDDIELDEPTGPLPGGDRARDAAFEREIEEINRGIADALSSGNWFPLMRQLQSSLPPDVQASVEQRIQSLEEAKKMRQRREGVVEAMGEVQRELQSVREAQNRREQTLQGGPRWTIASEPGSVEGAEKRPNYARRKGHEFMMIGVVVAVLPLFGLTLRGFDGPPLIICALGGSMVLIGWLISVSTRSGAGQSRRAQGTSPLAQNDRIPKVKPEDVGEASEIRRRRWKVLNRIVILFFLGIAAAEVWFLFFFLGEP